MKGRLLMSFKELSRKSLLERVIRKELSLVEASEQMRLSYRQALRVYQRFRAEGDAGLVHRRRGCRSNRAYPSGFREHVVAQYEEQYKSHKLGPTLAAEKLAQDGWLVAPETLRRWLLAKGLWRKRRRRAGHRSQRARRAHFGELVQMDGSHHAWLGSEGQRSCLMNLVDDATGQTRGLHAEEETTEAAMLALRRWIERFGIPRALYTDKKNVYLTARAPTLEEQLAGEEPRTAFGQACKKLDIEIITAHSPQAKGRVERSHAVYQDRYLKELGLRGITSVVEADALLAGEFCDALNARFARAPLEPQDFHRPLPPGLDLDNVFCFEALRVLQNDWTVRHENRYYQILKENTPLPKPKAKLLVRTHLDGRVHLLYGGKRLAYRVLSPHQVQRQRQRQAPPPAKAPRKPPAPVKRWRPNVDRHAILKDLNP